MENNDTPVKVPAESLGHGLLKFVFATTASFVASAIANQAFDAVAKRRQSKTTTN